jgi:hypothetical protein
MIKVQSSIVISKPVEQVFAFAANYENDAQWRNEVQQLKYGTLPVQIGTQATEVSKVFGQNLTTITEVTCYELNSKVSSKSVSGLVPIVVSREFRPISNGTEFTYFLEGDESNILIFRLLRPIIQRWYQATVEKYLRSLKHVLEAA